MNNESSILNDADLDAVYGGYSTGGIIRQLIGDEIGVPTAKLSNEKSFSDTGGAHT